MLSSKALLRVASIAALPACAALAFVACSGGARFAPAPGGVNNADRAASSVAQSIAPDVSLRGEVLTASSVTVKYVGHYGGGNKTTFTAKGVAKGPYPGTFTAAGVWYWGLLPNIISGFPPAPGWSFDEGFKISSGKGSIRNRIILGGGSCSTAACTGVPVTNMTFGPTSETFKLSLFIRSQTGHVSQTGTVKTSLIQAGSLTEWLY
jgi:hypothetical protein